MPFITDHAWTPTTYRVALAAWERNAPANESKVMPRQTEPTSSPRHGALTKQLRALLTWRAAASPKDWTSVAANDNKRPGEPEQIDSDYSIRPRESEIMRALKGVAFVERTHAKIGGGGEIDLVPVENDIVRGPVWRRSVRRGKEPGCIQRLGRIRFSNGANEESALIRDALGKISRGSVRIPLGGMIAIGPYKVYERFGAPKGADNDNEPVANVGIAPNPSAANFDFNDPVADLEHATWARQAVKPETADLLDFALTAANFRDVGEHLGYSGKTAERHGQKALMKACAEFETLLAA